MKTRLLLLLSALLLLAGCADNNKEQMLAQLAELERQNVADSLMTNDTLALQLTEYFDRHGTPNERLRAYYILGRTYTDLGDAPRALSSYQDAIMSADTTATDCDYAKLSRVYGWISELLLNQNLMEDYTKNIDCSVYYAWKAEDTVPALKQKARKVVAYINMHKPDSVLVLFDEAFNEMVHYVGIGLASKYSLIPVKTLLNRGELEKAKSLLDLYEHHSGFVDSAGNVVKGKEQYYYYKGYYYLCNEQLDSAEYYFRKELQNNNGFLEQNAGAYGLANLFRQQHRYDSATKYALYSYIMNDSLYARMATDEVERATAMFNYTRYQQKALHEQERASYEKARRTRMGYMLLLSLALLAIVVLLWRKKRKEAQEALMATLSELSHVQHELRQLQNQKHINQELISEKTETISRLESELVSLQRQELAFVDKERIIKQKSEELIDLQLKNDQLSRQIEEEKAGILQIQAELEKYRKKGLLAENVAESSLAESGVYLLLKKNTPLTFREWTRINNVVNDSLPAFSQLLLSKAKVLDAEESKLCVLFRLHCSQKEICVLMDMKQANVSKRASVIMTKLFNEKGGSKVLQRCLENYC